MMHILCSDDRNSCDKVATAVAATVAVAIAAMMVTSQTSCYLCIY